MSWSGAGLEAYLKEEFCYEHEQKKWGYFNGELLKCSGCLEEEPSPPIREDAFKYNSKCVCEKKEDNDYPCLCDEVEPTDEEYAVSHICYKKGLNAEIERLKKELEELKEPQRIFESDKDYKERKEMSNSLSHKDKPSLTP